MARLVQIQSSDIDAKNRVIEQLEEKVKAHIESINSMEKNTYETNYRTFEYANRSSSLEIQRLQLDITSLNQKLDEAIESSTKSSQLLETKTQQYTESVTSMEKNQ